MPSSLHIHRRAPNNTFLPIFFEVIPLFHIGAASHHLVIHARCVTLHHVTSRQASVYDSLLYRQNLAKQGSLRCSLLCISLHLCFPHEIHTMLPA